LIKSEKIDLEKDYKLQSDKYILFIGVLRKYKGLKYLIKAAKNVNIPLVVAGGGTLSKKLLTEAKSNNVNLLGFISDDVKMALIRNCRMLVLPSHLRSEAFGVVLIEAAMCRKPLISCEIGTGTSYANIDRKTGFVVPPRDVKALTDAIIQLSDNDNLAKEFGNSARKRYEKLFSGKVLGKAYYDLYCTVL